MTRAQGSGIEIEYAVTGVPGAARVVVVVRSGALATTDPDAGVTARHDVRLLLVDLDGEELIDPPAYGSATPAGESADQVRTILAREAHAEVVGMVAEAAAVPFAVTLCAQLGDRVDRLALVGAPSPESPLARDVLAERLRAVRADTVVFAVSTHDEGPASWYAEQLPRGRAEMRASDPNSADHRLALTTVWPDVLAHVVPG
ncbi:hypothetical protein ACIQLJ_09285 [Microbacterium sp. NPDC091313]